MQCLPVHRWAFHLHASAFICMQVLSERYRGTKKSRLLFGVVGTVTGLRRECVYRFMGAVLPRNRTPVRIIANGARSVKSKITQGMSVNAPDPCADGVYQAVVLLFIADGLTLHVIQISEALYKLA